MTEHVELSEITPEQAALLQRVMADEFAAADAVCIDFWGPDARAAKRIPDDAQQKPPVLMTTGSPIAHLCGAMLADPFKLDGTNPREERARKAFEGWVRMHMEHRRYCAACRLGNEMPGGFR